MSREEQRLSELVRSARADGSGLTLEEALEFYVLADPEGDVSDPALLQRAHSLKPYIEAHFNPRITAVGGHAAPESRAETVSSRPGSSYDA